MAQSFGDTGVFSWPSSLNMTEADHSSKEGIASLSYNFPLSNNWGATNTNTSLSADVSNHFPSLFASSLWGAPSSTGVEPNDSTAVITHSTSTNIGTSNVWQAPVFSSPTSSDSNLMIFSPNSNTPRTLHGATPTPRSPLMTTHAQTHALEMLPVNTSSPSGWPQTTHSVTVNTPHGGSSQADAAMPSPLLINTWPVTPTTAASGVGPDGSPNSGKQDSAAFTKSHLSRGNSLATNQSKTTTNGAIGSNGAGQINSADMDRMMTKINSTEGWNACYVDQKTAWLEDEQNTRQRAAAESNVWANEPPNGTGIWEKHYEAIGERIARWNPSTVPPSLSWESAPSTPGSTAPSTLPSWPRSAGLNSPGGGGMNPSSSVSSSHWHDPSPSFHSDTSKEKMTSPMEHDTYRVGRGGEQTRAMALNRLKSLGYSTEVATNALISNNMDVERALNFLRSNSINSATTANPVPISNSLRFTQQPPQQQQQPQQHQQQAQSLTSAVNSLQQRMPTTSPITANNPKQLADSQQYLQTLVTQENHLRKAATTIQQEMQRLAMISNGPGNITTEQKVRISQLEQQYQYCMETLHTIRQKQQQLNATLQPRTNRGLGGMNSSLQQRAGNNAFGGNADLTAMQLADMRINSFMPGQINNNGNDFNEAAIGSQWSNMKDDALLSANNPLSRPLFGGKNDIFDDGFPQSDGLSAIGGRRRQPDLSAFTEPSLNSLPMGPHFSLANQTQNFNANPRSTNSHWVIVRNVPVHIKPENLRGHLLQNNIVPLHFQPLVINHWVLIGLANPEDAKRAVNLLQQSLPPNCTVDHVSEQEVLMRMKELEHLASRFGTPGTSASGYRLGGTPATGGGLSYNFASGMGNTATANPYGSGSTPTTNPMPWSLPLGSGNEFTTPFAGSEPGSQAHLHSHQLSLSSMQQNAAMFSLLQRSQAPGLANNNLGAGGGANAANDPFMLMNLAANRSNTGAPNSGHY